MNSYSTEIDAIRQDRKHLCQKIARDLPKSPLTTENNPKITLTKGFCRADEKLFRLDGKGP